MRPRTTSSRHRARPGDGVLRFERSSKKKEGRRGGPPIRLPALDLVEALPTTCGRGAISEPPTLARRFPVVPGTHLYPLVPPLPILESSTLDHLLSAIQTS